MAMAFLRPFHPELEEKNITTGCFTRAELGHKRATATAAPWLPQLTNSTWKVSEEEVEAITKRGD